LKATDFIKLVKFIDIHFLNFYFPQIMVTEFMGDRHNKKMQDQIRSF